MALLTMPSRPERSMQMLSEQPLLSSTGQASPITTVMLFLAGLFWPAELQDYGDNVHQEGKR